MNQITGQSIKIRITILSVIFALLGFLFASYPQLDLAITNLAYQKGSAFALREMLFFRALGYSAKGLAALLMLLCLASIFYQYYKTRKCDWRKYKAALFLLIVFAIGPMIMVKLGLKEISGRPRPYATEEFGGALPFADIAEFGRGECLRNCSFPSGHAAVGYFFIALAFLPRFYRNRYIIESMGWTLGLALGFSRIATGYHFLSDILFSGFVVYSVILVCYWMMFLRN